MNTPQSVHNSIPFASYADLKTWLYAEIGEVPVATIQKYHPPASLGDISQLSQKEANDLLKKVFIEQFLSETDYERQVAFLSQTTPRETRLKIKSPLPSTDFCILLSATPEVDYLQRAAALSYAAGKLHLQFLTGDLSTALSRGKKSNCSIYNNIFGNSIIPGEIDNKINISKDSTHINVLFRGNAYTIEIISQGNLIAPAQIRALFAKIVEEPVTEGVIGLLRSIPLPLASELGKSLNLEALEKLHSALFSVCLDEIPPDQSSARNLNDLFTSIFSGNRHNRWYGSTQIVVRTDGEAALIFSYMGGLDGVPANEVAVELYNQAREISWAGCEAKDFDSTIGRVELKIPDSMVETLQVNSASLFHECPSVFTLPLGLNFFKKIRVSPNIAIHFLLMLAFKEAGNLSYLPETSQAIMVREQFWGGVQLDWLRARPEILRQFLENPTEMSLFRKAIEAHHNLILKSRESLSPFLFFDNRAEDKDREWLDFYLWLGQEEAVGAYRHYLCPITRNPQALDLITSSLKLWKGIELIGRPGTRSHLVNLSGSHILFNPEQTHIVFIPTQPWENRLPLVMERLLYWMNHLEQLTANETKDSP